MAEMAATAFARRGLLQLQTGVAPRLSLSPAGGALSPHLQRLLAAGRPHRLRVVGSLAAAGTSARAPSLEVKDFIDRVTQTWQSMHIAVL